MPAFLLSTNKHFDATFYQQKVTIFYGDIKYAWIKYEYNLWCALCSLSEQGLDPDRVLWKIYIYILFGHHPFLRVLDYSVKQLYLFKVKDFKMQ